MGVSILEDEAFIGRNEERKALVGETANCHAILGRITWQFKTCAIARIKSHAMADII